MECPKCGKRVRSTARFCENCGKTLRMPEPQNNFEKYEAYRRERARRVKAREKKKRIRRRRLKMLAVIVIVAAAVCAAVFIGKNGAQTKPSASPSPSASVSPSPTAAASNKISSKKKTGGAAAYDDISEECDIYENPDKGIDIPYPSSMTESGESNDKTQKSIKTADGDANMIISAERTGQDTTVNQLLNTYKSGIGVSDSQSEIDDGGEYYVLDFDRGGEHKHRMGIIKEDYHIYYDFSYNNESDSVGKYREYIDYIDYYLKKSIDAVGKPGEGEASGSGSGEASEDDYSGDEQN